MKKNNIDVILNLTFNKKGLGSRMQGNRLRKEKWIRYLPSTNLK